MTLVSAPIAIMLTRGLHGLSFGLFWISVVALVSMRSPSEAPASGQALLGAGWGTWCWCGCYWGLGLSKLAGHGRCISGP